MKFFLKINVSVGFILLIFLFSAKGATNLSPSPQSITPKSIYNIKDSENIKPVYFSKNNTSFIDILNFFNEINDIKFITPLKPKRKIAPPVFAFSIIIDYDFKPPVKYLLKKNDILLSQQKINNIFKLFYSNIYSYPDSDYSVFIHKLQL